jgi:hypothetical protein
VGVLKLDATVSITVRNVLGTWVWNHLLCEAWPDPLGMTTGVVARVSLRHSLRRSDSPPTPKRSDRQPMAQPPLLGFSEGCSYIYVLTPKIIHHLTFGGTPSSNMVIRAINFFFVSAHL